MKGTKKKKTLASSKSKQEYTNTCTLENTYFNTSWWAGKGGERLRNKSGQWTGAMAQ